MADTTTPEPIVKADIALEGWSAVPKTMDAQLRFAKWAVVSGLLPDSITTVAQAWVVMQRGAELGFPGLTAFEFLYVVNGRVRLSPDGAKAKALASGLLEDAREEVLGDGEAMLARVTVKRRGLPTPVVAEFSVDDAKTAKLWGKTGTKGPSSWVTHPKRMLKARARGFAYGDAFRDVVGGLPVREPYDLDPGEVLGGTIEAPRAPIPPFAPGPDPLLDDLAAINTTTAGPVVVVSATSSGPPPPFASHAEADAAIAASEQADLFGIKSDPDE